MTSTVPAPAEPAAAAPAAPPRDRDALDRGLLLVASVVVLGAIMSILDTTVVNVAINTLARDFRTPLSTIQWVATGYTLALATVIPLTGWAADRFGTKRLYMLSIALFVGGSVLSGMAWSAGSLIAFRILQGLGGGMIMPAGMTILTRAAGPHRMGRVMSIVGVPMLLGPVLGPILGGFLVDQVSWRWIFFINLPIGIGALFLARRVLPRDRPEPRHRLDLLGVLLLSPSLAAIIYGLAETNSHGGFGSAQVLVPIAAGVVTLGFWVRHTLRRAEPLIDLALFRNRTFAAASGTLVLFSTAAFGALLLLPLYLQVVRGQDALHTGLLLAPQGLGAMIAMPIAGQLTDRIGPGRIVLVGLTLVIATFVGLTQLGGDTSYWLIGGDLVLFGMGMGAAMMPTFSAAMMTLKRAEVARASTALNILQQVGASIGTAVLSVLLAGALADRLPGGSPGGGGGGIGGSAKVPPAVRDKVAGPMADAFGQTFWWAVGVLAIAYVGAFLLPRFRAQPPDDPEDDEPEPDADAAPEPLVVGA
jgi:EmrB/QacA subfamily drug resistance transporter